MVAECVQASTPLVKCAISDESPLQRFGAVKLGRQSHTLSIFRDLIQLDAVPHHRPTEIPANRPNKAAITNFSGRSRTNFLTRMAKARNTGPLYFVTLTYRDEEWFTLTPRDLQRHLENICKRIESRHSHAGEIWRKEWTTRKSGDHIGCIAPHLHMIVRGVDQDVADFSRWLKGAWAEISGAASKGASARIDCQVAHSYKHAARYVSKYVAKLPDAEDESQISEFFHKWAGEVGRHWGMRGEWDMTHSTILPVAAKQSIILKRLVRGWLRSRGKGKFERRVRRIRADFGMKAFGLGDQERDVLASEVLRMWRHAGDLSGWT